MSDMNDHGHNKGYAPVPDTYALTGKIMLSAIVVLFTVVIFIICLHIYARWYIARRQRQHQQYLRERRRRRAHIVFVTDLSSSADTLSHGLEASLLNSLPTFVYTSATQKEVLECAVCLSEFEENEKGRLLPKCNHSFHIDCIDMWFHSHSTCPLCRSPVTKPEFQEPAQTETVINLDNSRPDGRQETSSPCSSSGNTSLGSRRKAFDITGVSIDVPRRTEEMVQGSPAGVFKSPGARLLSFKMRLGRDRRHSSASISCSSAMEIDLERGEIEEEHVHVPRPSEHQQSSTTD